MIERSIPQRAPLGGTDDSYPLSPMQQGMLYDTIESSAPGMYCIVVSYRLEGSIDPAKLFDAWRMVIARHPILRSTFHWKERSEPMQVVHANVSLPTAELDWRGLDETEQQNRLGTLLESENAQGFDIEKPPLLRLTLVRCAPAKYELVVAHHHLLLDGSCKPLLFGELFSVYEALLAGRPVELPPARPYRCYVEWLRQQDIERAEQFWRQELLGVVEPTPLWPTMRPEDGETQEYLERHVVLDDDTSMRLRTFARERRLTLNTLVCGAWAVVLGYASGRNDVVFGATVNARPQDLDGVDTMLGLFINTLPVRVPIAAAVPVAKWLGDLQLRYMTAREYDFAPLSLIQRWSAIPRRVPLFESIVVFENNPGFASDVERYGSVEVTNVRALIRNSLPLTLRCVPGRSIAIHLLYDGRRFTRSVVDGIADRVVRVLVDMTRHGDDSVSRLIDSLEEADRRKAVLEADAFQQTLRNRLSRRLHERRAVSEGS